MRNSKGQFIKGEKPLHPFLEGHKDFNPTGKGRFEKGNKNWLGGKHTKKTKQKLREINLGKKYPYKARPNAKGRKVWNKGIKTGLVPKTAFQKGHISPNKGKEFFHLRGKNANNWRGGISYEPYSVDWTKTLKRAIRERDKYTCQICGELQGDRALDVHHIDYNKKNCNPNNLITLCHKCHTKTNGNRDYWMNYFNE